ncbi:MAG: hypothetical protein FJ121_08380 [Deltaproteobacteria bacterium]|nr:hypothetical protein [Deltaproteobacteria bacterium]
MLGASALSAGSGHQVTREYVYVMTAVSPLDGRLTSLIMPWVDDEAMSIFLAPTEQAFAGDFCLLLRDGAGWHRARELRVSQRMICTAPWQNILSG